VAAFILGPDKLADFAKDAGKVAGELKEVPKEFQAGIQEGEMAALEQKKRAQQEESVQDAEVTEGK
jgi:sec-independent protein translocase protein TatA